MVETELEVDGDDFGVREIALGREIESLEVALIKAVVRGWFEAVDRSCFRRCRSFPVALVTVPAVSVADGDCIEDSVASSMRFVGI